MKLNRDAIPQYLKDLPNWVLWRYEERTDERGKTSKTKVLYQTSGRRAKSNTPNTWATFEVVSEAYDRLSQKYDGIGFVVNPPLFGMDLDSCIPPDGQLMPWAANVLEHCPTYCEVSPSGAGLKLIGIGDFPLPMHKPDGKLRCSRKYDQDLTAAVGAKNPELVFVRQKFFTVTGQVYGDRNEVRDCPRLPDLYNALFPKQPRKSTKAASVRTDEYHERSRAAMAAIAKVPVADNNDGSRRLMSYCRQAKRWMACEDDALRVVKAALNLNPTPVDWSDDQILRRLNECESEYGEAFEAETDAPATAYLNSQPSENGHKNDENGPSQGRNPNNSRENDSFVTGAQEQKLNFEPFPTHVLPDAIGEYVRQVAESICCDESFVAMPILAGLAAAIGNSNHLVIKRGWSVPPILWSVIVAPSGAAKSAPHRQALRPIYKRQSRLLAAYDQEMKRFDIEQEAYLRDLATYKKSKDGDPPTQPTEPVCPRVICDDTTIEALGQRLVENPRGIICAKDELSGWFASFTRYKDKGGSDEPKWLEFYGAQHSIIDRSRAKRPLVINKASVCVSGTIQPLILKKQLTDEHKASGLAARLLFAMPPIQLKQWSFTEVSEATEDRVSDIFDALYSFDMRLDKEGELQPNYVHLDNPALKLFISYYNRHNKEQLELGGELRAAWSKLEEYAARLALVDHCVRCAIDSNKSKSVVDYASMEAGIFLCEWFKHEAKRVYAVLSQDDQAEENMDVLSWCKLQGRPVPPRDVHRKFKKRLETVDRAEALLQQFVSEGHGQWVSIDSSKAGGRPTRGFLFNAQGRNPTFPKGSEGFRHQPAPEPVSAGGEPWNPNGRF